MNPIAVQPNHASPCRAGTNCHWLPRLLAILVVLATVRAGMYAFVLTPPWQAPDEPGHFEYIRLLSENGLSRPSAQDERSIQNEIIISLAQRSFWELIGRDKDGLRPVVFLQDPDLHSQWRDEPPLYYLPPAIFIGISSDITTQLYRARAWSMVLFLCTISFIVLGLREISPSEPYLPIFGGAFAALCPMPAFIGGSCNNDTAAMAISAIVLWWLFRGTRRGWDRKRLAVLLMLMLVAFMTKKTTFFLLPFSVVVLLCSPQNKLVSVLRSDKRIIPALIFGVCASVVLLAWMASLWHADGASGWMDPHAGQMATRMSSSARSGEYAFRIPAADSPSDSRIDQSIPYSKVLAVRGQVLELSAWVSGPDHSWGQGFLAIYDGQVLSRQPFEWDGGRWQRVTMQHHVSPKASQIRVVVGNQSVHSLAADDISLRDIHSNELIRNAGAEEGASWYEALLARRLSLSPTLVPRPFDPDSYSASSLARYALYIGLTFAGFWANFGWLTLPLDPQWYLVPFILCVTAMAGLMMGFFRHRTGRGEKHIMAGLMITGFLLIVFQTFIPMIGSSWQPQGRYFFPALLLIAGLLGLGWRELMPCKARLPFAALLIVVLIAFEQLCIWGYIIPHNTSHLSWSTFDLFMAVIYG